MKNPWKNNASKKVLWNGKRYTSVIVFCTKMETLFNERMYPAKVRRLMKSDLSFHGHKIKYASKQAKPVIKKKTQDEPLVWNNTSFDNIKDMSDILEVKKSVIRTCLRKDEPFQGNYIDYKL